ncbi:uncharacterized protein LOC126763326 isoform X5 [Bactrocera neohumeralis]|uniref:uncharacterized protein LOC126763326 isoform X5 n=1 Tax=Bactrocera neohumeralis TaxID=98809 RepID=UPI0021660BA3|nr:uncharacterized protein LOC126763326 isoform X5 [Bactrocera neohumeralis]XP_050336658.1 uncharacterized protein LOC126763326 isoform X5 [Bactrocera neohumeralis]
MVLRSGIIIPFQFRDSKKLLMIGVPEENRNLNIWDLRNVVRAAFGIYNFEFRNKKIGFNIPDELLLHYLAQRHDLTNFVIEIGQANLNDIPDNGIADSSCVENFIPTDISLQLHENIHLEEVQKRKYRDPFDGRLLSKVFRTKLRDLNYLLLTSKQLQNVTLVTMKSKKHRHERSNCSISTMYKISKTKNFICLAQGTFLKIEPSLTPTLRKLVTSNISLLHVQ